MEGKTNNLDSGQRYRDGILDSWAKHGVLHQRALTEHEQIIIDRARKSDGLFKPIYFVSGCKDFSPPLSIQLDAFDHLPLYPHLSFDLMWSSFDAITSTISTPRIKAERQQAGINSTRITEREKLQFAARHIDTRIIETLCAKIPLQSCEYLVRKLLDPRSNRHQESLKNRMTNDEDPDLKRLWNHLNQKYAVVKDQTLVGRRQRQGGVFLQRMLSGEELELIDGTRLEPTPHMKAFLLIQGLLYTYRNERFHGALHAPFKSSKARLKTYAHAYYCFLATYYLSLALISHFSPSLEPDLEAIETSFAENQLRAKPVYRDS